MVNKEKTEGCLLTKCKLLVYFNSVGFGICFRKYMNMFLNAGKCIVWDFSRENGIYAVYLDVICMSMKTEISKMSDVS